MIKSISAFIMALIIAASPMPASKSEPKDDFRAVWVSTVANLDWPSKPGLSVNEMKAEADAIIERSAAIGLNAVILQVRPCADALYKSDIFPWSDSLTGTQGQAPPDDFDPLEYWIEKCHGAGLELHAWINPYRVMRTSTQKLSADNPASLNPSWVIPYGEGRVFDPGLPECRELIISGVAEIVSNYDVDGIHLDDYFYPYPVSGVAFGDTASFKAYGNGQSLDNWRRENVNTLIRDIGRIINDTNQNVRYGVSPFAIWMNKSSSEEGSETSGLESYKAIYADSRKWVREGWLDYIAPQIYWRIGYTVADYQKLVAWWADVVKDTSVDLYIGHAVYREVQQEEGWNGETIRQLRLNEQTPEVKGSIFFRAGFLNGALGNAIGEYYAEKQQVKRITGPAIKMTELSVAQPSGNVTVSGATAYTVHGTCDPDTELYLNGNSVTNITPEGFFSAYVGLAAGANILTFSQEGQNDVVRIITVKKGTESGGSSPGAVTLPKFTLIPADAKYYATVSDISAWVYPGATTVGGSSWLLKQGQRDLVTAKTDDDKWVRLSCGAWIETASVTLAYEQTLKNNVLTSGVYAAGETTDIIKWKATENIAANVSFEDGKLTLSFGMQSSVPELNIDSLANTLFSAYNSGVKENAAYYSFTAKESAKIEGIYTEYADGEFRLIIKKRKSASNGAAPLTGFRFVIDAGHGGTDSGAIGPMGGVNTEADINLKHALKLAARLRWLGAEVTLTRETDVFLTLYERTEISRMINPDMFISIHANSVAETTDSSNIKGLTVWHRNELFNPLSTHLSERLAQVNPLTTRSKVANTSNFYVCRPLWTPSVLIETSFICNIWDFAWLISDASQNEFADRTASAILSYYKD